MGQPHSSCRSSRRIAHLAPALSRSAKSRGKVSRMNKVSGKNILITGASQGLGREMALRFAREGAAGLSLVARHGDKLNAVRDEIQKLRPSRTGGHKIDPPSPSYSAASIVIIEADVSKPRDIE